MLLLGVAFAEPLPAPGDKTGYPVAVVASAGAMDHGTVRLGAAWAFTPRFSVHGGVSWTEGVLDPVYDEFGLSEWVHRKPGWRGDGGVAWNIPGNGLEGYGVAVKAGGQRLRWESGRAPRADLRVYPTVWARWIGHPGISLGVEAGVSARLCCGENPDDSAVGGLGLVEVGWALPPGPSPSAVAQQLTADQRRKRHQRVVAVTAVAVGAVAVTGVAAVIGLQHPLDGMSFGTWSYAGG